MRTLLSAKDLANVRGFSVPASSRRIQKVKKAKGLKPNQLISLADYCDFYNDNYVELYALLNSNNHKEFINLYTKLKMEVFVGVN